MSGAGKTHERRSPIDGTAPLMGFACATHGLALRRAAGREADGIRGGPLEKGRYSDAPPGDPRISLNSGG